MKAKIVVLGITIVLVISIALMTTVSATTEETRISIPDIEIASGESKTVPIVIKSVTDIYRADIILVYDESIVHVTTIGESKFDICYEIIDNPAGVIRIIAAQECSDGLNGDVKLANITFKAVGSAGESSTLNISVFQLRTITGAKIPVETDNGIFTITRENVILIDNIEVSQNESVTTPILINGTNVGGVEIYLNYNPKIVNITNITTGNLGGYFYFDLSKTQNGSVRIAVLCPEFSGHKTIANIELTAVGNPGDTSDLSFENILMIDDAGIELVGTTQNGTFTISAPMLEPMPEQKIERAEITELGYSVYHGQLYAKIENTGNVDFPWTYRTLFYIQGEDRSQVWLYDRSVLGLCCVRSGEFAYSRIDVPLNTKPGNYTVWALVYERTARCCCVPVKWSNPLELKFKGFPDVAIESIVLTPAKVGDTVWIQAPFENIGSAEMPFGYKIEVQVLKDNVVQCDEVFEGQQPLAPGEKSIFSHRTSYTFPEAGEYKVRVVIDSANIVRELGEYNNRKTVAIQVGAPDLTVTNISWTPTNPKPTESIIVTTTVKNIGTAESNLITMHLSVPDIKYSPAFWFRKTLYPGDTFNYTWGVGELTNPLIEFPSSGNYSITAEVDIWAHVSELNETNNAMNKTICIKK